MRGLVRCIGLATLLFSGLACSVSDYEKRMDEQRKYLAKFDEEIKLIAPPQSPLSAPPQPRVIEKDKDKKKQKEYLPGLSEGFFLRAPREIARQPEGEPALFPASPPGQVVLYRYPGGADPKKGDPKKTPPLFQAVFASTARIEDAGSKNALTPEEFRHRMLQALKTVANLGATMPKIREEDWKPDRGSLECQFSAGAPDADFKDDKAKDKPPKDKPPKDKVIKDKAKEKASGDKLAWHFFVYHVEQQNASPTGKRIQAAIVYQVPYAKRDEGLVKRTIDTSLGTLALGAEAAKKHQTKVGRPR